MTSRTGLDLIGGESAQLNVSKTVMTTLCREREDPSQGPPLHFLKRRTSSSYRNLPLTHSNVASTLLRFLAFPGQRAAAAYVELPVLG